MGVWLAAGWPCAEAERVQGLPCSSICLPALPPPTAPPPGFPAAAARPHERPSILNTVGREAKREQAGQPAFGPVCSDGTRTATLPLAPTTHSWLPVPTGARDVSLASTGGGPMPQAMGGLTGSDLGGTGLAGLGGSAMGDAGEAWVAHGRWEAAAGVCAPLSIQAKCRALPTHPPTRLPRRGVRRDGRRGRRARCPSASCRSGTPLTPPPSDAAAAAADCPAGARYGGGSEGEDVGIAGAADFGHTTAGARAGLGCGWQLCLRGAGLPGTLWASRAAVQCPWPFRRAVAYRLPPESLPLPRPLAPQSRRALLRQHRPRW